MVPFVVCALHQEAFAGSSAVASNDPLPDHSSSTVVLPFAELRLVDLHDVPPSSDLPGCSVLQKVLHPTLSNSFVKGSHCFLVHIQDPGCTSNAGTVDEDPK